MQIKLKSSKAAALIAALFITVAGGAKAFADSSVTYTFPTGSPGYVNGGTANTSTPSGSLPSTFITNGQSGNDVYVPGFSTVLFPYKTLTEVKLTLTVTAVGAASTWTNNSGSYDSDATVANNTSIEFYGATGGGPLGAAGSITNIKYGSSATLENDWDTTGSTQQQTLNSNYTLTHTVSYFASTTNLSSWIQTSPLAFYYSHKQYFTDNSGQLTLSGIVDPDLQISGQVTYYYVDAPVPAALFLGLIPLAGMVALKVSRKGRKNQNVIPAV